ncbi:unnamed protein product [Amoebophrya sp. A25]|nr:unnamed protein product [Amoebophrya sp. A25]|eukprot:GSA25T00025880001.1
MGNACCCEREDKDPRTTDFTAADMDSVERASAAEAAGEETSIFNSGITVSFAGSSASARELKQRSKGKRTTKSKLEATEGVALGGDGFDYSAYTNEPGSPAPKSQGPRADPAFGAPMLGGEPVGRALLGTARPGMLARRTEEGSALIPGNTPAGGMGALIAGNANLMAEQRAKAMAQEEQFGGQGKAVEDEVMAERERQQAADSNMTAAERVKRMAEKQAKGMGMMGPLGGGMLDTTGVKLKRATNAP